MADAAPWPTPRNMDSCYLTVPRGDGREVTVALTDMPWPVLEAALAADPAQLLHVARTLHERLRTLGDTLNLSSEAFSTSLPRQRPDDAPAKLAAVQRELDYRRRNYPRWVAEGRMKPAAADAQIAIFDQIEKDYL